MNNIIKWSILILILSLVCEIPYVHRFIEFNLLNHVNWNEMIRIGDKYAKQVKILRDDYGVPHIFGKRNADATFGLAYAHAEDDFVVLQQVILAGKGELAAVYGSKLAPNDWMNRLLKVQTFMKNYENELDSATRQVAESYASGLNYYAAKHQDEVISTLLFPITGKDIAAAFVHKIPLMFKFNELLENLMKNKNINLTSEIRNAIPFMSPIGSNTVAISPKRTADNSTMLSVNSHQPWDGHASWYEAHIHSYDEGWDLTGNLLPGSPFPNMGHNQHYGWAHTVNRPDIVDIFRLKINPNNENQYWFNNKWHNFEKIDDAIRVRLWGPFYWSFSQTFEYSIHGPVLRGVDNNVHAVRYATWGTIKYLEQGYKAATAKSFNDFKKAMSMPGRVPMFNVNYADKNGNIFYAWNAVIPKRNPKFNWMDILPGDDADAVWSNEYESFESLPIVENPSSGFTQNCNNSPLNTTIGKDNPQAKDFSHTYGIEPELTNRGLRYLRLLSNDKSITFENFIKYKWDLMYDVDSFVMKQVKRIVNWSKKQNFIKKEDELLKNAIQHLSEWNGSTHEDNLHAALGVLTIEKYIDILLWVIKSYPSDPIENDINPLISSLNHSAHILLNEFNTLNVKYGQVNRLVKGNVNMPMGGGPDIIHAVHRVPLDKSNPNSPIRKGFAGDGSLQLIQWKTNGECIAYTVHQYGNAVGRPESKHYNDQVKLMAKRQLRRVYHTEAEIRQHLEAEYHPGETF